MQYLSEFARRLGGEVHAGGNILCPGPGHSARDRSLSVRFDSDQHFTVYSFANDDWQTCADHVRALCGLPQFESRTERRVAAINPTPPVNRRIENVAVRQRVAKLWREAINPRRTLVETYLLGRGLILPDEVAGRAIRFHPRCPWRDQPDDPVIFVPAMLSRYCPILQPEADEPTALHRTRLKPDGSGHAGKKMIGSPLGQCVKLSPDEDVTEALFVSEGIENGLRGWQRGWLPAWSATTAGAIRTFPVLPGISCLTILADHDGPGLAAAQQCADRWTALGRDVFIRFSKTYGGDFADEAMP